MLVVNDDNLGESGVVVIEETGVDPDAAGATVPLASEFKGRAVAECGATAMRVEVMRDLFSLSPVHRVVERQRGRFKRHGGAQPLRERNAVAVGVLDHHDIHLRALHGCNRLDGALSEIGNLLVSLLTTSVADAFPVRSGFW